MLGLGIGRLLGLTKPRKKKPDWKNFISLTATESERLLIEKYASFTMTPPKRQYGLLNAINYLDRIGLEGDIVECGVWRGGNCMMVKEQRKDRAIKRAIYLFDTFCGMTAPTNIDVTQFDDIPAKTILQDYHSKHQKALASCSIEEAKQNFVRCGLDFNDVIFVEGPVEQTLRDEANLPKAIALLRLDTDWYESTKAELEVLYPRLAPGGVLIVDDYDYWRGSRAAVDEYFVESGPLLNPLDYECRIGVKPN